MEKKLLIISNSDELYYYKPVIKVINEIYNHDVYVFDFNQYPRTATMSVSLSNSRKVCGSLKTTQWSKGQSRKGVMLEINDVFKVWPIRIGNTNVNPELDPVSALFAKKQAHYAIESLLALFECEVINPPRIARFVQHNKLYQLEIAKWAGLSIPDTLVSSNYSDVCEFAEKCGGSMLVKSIYTMPFLNEDTKEMFGIYSSIITKRELTSFSVKACPNIYQAYIEKKVELRISYANGKIMTCSIDSQLSEKTKIDWRNYDFGNVKHTTYKLPKDIQRTLVKYMTRIGLKYGQIDMILTPNDEYVFLEVNPSGQWGWIQGLTGLEIDHSIAKMLIE